MSDTFWRQKVNQGVTGFREKTPCQTDASDLTSYTLIVQ